MSDRVLSGNKDLDLVLGGGFPPQSITLIGGMTGTGKTTLAHQILYANLKKESRAIYMNVLGPSFHKILGNIQGYEFFNAELLLKSILYEESGEFLEQEGLKRFLDYLFVLLSQNTPEFFVFDGIHRLRAMGASEAEYQGFLHQLAGLLSAVSCTVFWVGSFTESSCSISPEAALSDSALFLAQEEKARTLKVTKLARTPCVPEFYRFSISERGLRIHPQSP